MDLYCFEWLKQESTNNRKTKTRENSNKQNFKQCSLVGYGSDFTHETGCFDIFTRAPNL